MTELELAVWWARSWSVAFLQRETNDDLERFQQAPGRTAPVSIRGVYLSLGPKLRSRVHFHEKRAWTRLEWLSKNLAKRETESNEHD